MTLEKLYQWKEELAKRFWGLSKPQVFNLAVFSFGVILARDCRLAIVSEHLGLLGKPDTVERRLQRLLDNHLIKMDECFRWWATWILMLLENEIDRVVLLVDETKLSNHLGIMMVGITYRQRCIPLIWRCYSPKAYPPEGQVKMIEGLLEKLTPILSFPPLLQADRGIGTSPELIRVVENLGWKYLFRVQSSSHLKRSNRPAGPLIRLAERGKQWSGKGRIFKKDGFQIEAFVHVTWVKSYEDPWCLVTNDPNLTGDEYALRVWQEEGFRDLKSGGWKWDDSHVWQPDHAERLLLILALAYVWILSQGTLILQADEATRRLVTRGKRCLYSVFRLGLRYFSYMLSLAQPVKMAFYLVPSDPFPAAQAFL